MVTKKDSALPVKAEPMPAQEATTFESTHAISADVKAENVGALQVMAREEATVKALVVMAKKYPRNELQAYNKILKMCERPRFAEDALYSYPRGGSQIEGPSINLATGCASAWGNLKSGHCVLSDTEDKVHIMGFAWDLETNRFESFDDEFKKLIQRKGEGWIKPDERDLRELINRRGAILERNALLRVLPKDVVEEALDKCKETTRLAASGQLKQDRKKTIRSLVAAFEQVGVSADMLSKFLNHDLDIVNEEEVAKLRAIWKSISDGNSRREEHFEVPKPKEQARGAIDASQIAAKEAPKKE